MIFSTFRDNCIDIYRNCSVCITQTEPNIFKKSKLLQFKTKNVLQWKCDESFEDVNVLALLDGVQVETMPEWSKETQQSNTIFNDNRRYINADAYVEKDNNGNMAGRDINFKEQ